MLVSVLANMSSEIIIHPTGSGRFVWRDTGTALRPISFAIPKELAGEFATWIAGFRRLAKGTKKEKRVSRTAIDNIGKELSKKLSLALGGFRHHRLPPCFRRSAGRSTSAF